MESTDLVTSSKSESPSLLPQRALSGNGCAPLSLHCRCIGHRGRDRGDRGSVPSGRLHGNVIQLDLPLLQVVKIALRFHLVSVYWEIWRCHLFFHHTL